MRDKVSNADVIADYSDVLDFIGGVDLTAQRRSDGLLYSYYDSSKSIADWPAEIQVGRITYTLEDIRTGKDGYETAIYV